MQPGWRVRGRQGLQERQAGTQRYRPLNLMSAFNVSRSTRFSAAATPLQRGPSLGEKSRDKTRRRSGASLRGHCRCARWLRISACAWRVQVPSAPPTLRHRDLNDLGALSFSAASVSAPRGPAAGPFGLGSLGCGACPKDPPASSSTKPLGRGARRSSPGYIGRTIATKASGRSGVGSRRWRGSSPVRCETGTPLLLAS